MTEDNKGAVPTLPPRKGETGAGQALRYRSGRSSLQSTNRCRLAGQRAGLDAHLVADEDNPPDAFEVALLDAATMDPLLGPAAGLTGTDAFLNLQATGEVYFGYVYEEAHLVAGTLSSPVGSVPVLGLLSVTTVEYGNNEVESVTVRSLNILSWAE